MEPVPEALALSYIFNAFAIKPGSLKGVDYADRVMRHLKRAGWGAKNVNRSGLRSAEEMQLRGAEIEAAFRLAGFKTPLLDRGDETFDNFVKAVMGLGFAPPPLPPAPTKGKNPRI